MDERSVATRGRTLDHAAKVYDFCEPILLLGKQGAYNREIVALLELEPGQRVLDLGCGTGELTQDASAASLRALTRSGAQEASEEGGVGEIPTPERVLRDIHHYKTGLLFQCPWAVPGVIETGPGPSADKHQDHLYQIGMGCQLLDDIVDLEADVRERRYNYAWSTIFHGAEDNLRNELQAAYQQQATGGRLANLHGTFPRILAAVAAEGQHRLEEGLQGLLRADHRHLAVPLRSFLIRRIGADHFLQGITTA
jgi:hypothetical protein